MRYTVVGIIGLNGRAVMLSESCFLMSNCLVMKKSSVTKMAEYVILIVFHSQNKHKSNDDNTTYHRREAAHIGAYLIVFRLFNAFGAS